MKTNHYMKVTRSIQSTIHLQKRIDDAYGKIECKTNRMKNRKELTGKKIMSLLKRHNDILKKYKVRRIGLFGSYVRGEQKKQSDVDFLAEFEEPTFDNFMDLVFSLEDLFSEKVELITNGNLSPYILPCVEKEVRWHET